MQLQEGTCINADAVVMEDPFTDCKQEEMHVTADAVVMKFEDQCPGQMHL